MTVPEFIDAYGKHERYAGRGAEYLAAVIRSAQAEIERYGYVLISRHDSVTGDVVILGTPPPTWKLD